MRRYFNCSYFFKAKRNYVLPKEMRRYVFRNSVRSEGFIRSVSYLRHLTGLNDIPEGKERSISEIARVESTRPFLGNVLQKLAVYFDLRKGLELGTSLGVGTMFQYFGKFLPLNI